MKDKELLDFIEKLFANFKDDKICFDCEIEKLDKSKMNHNTELYDKCINEKLLYELSITSDKLTERGKNLKRLKTFKKLIKSEKPSIWEKHKNLIMAVGVLFGILTFFQTCDFKHLTSKKEIESHHPKDSFSKQLDKTTIDIKISKNDTL